MQSGFSMETDQPKKFQALRLTAWIFVVLVIPCLCLDFLWGNNITFFQRLHYPSGTIKTAEPDPDSLDFLLSRLVKEQDLDKFRATGFSCDSQLYSKHCVTNRAIQIDTKTMTVTIPSNKSIQETWLRPYARQQDEILLKTITPVKIIQGNTTPPLCDYNHSVPAVVFSSNGFIGNTFHEFNEIIVPLYITTRLFRSRVILLMEDYKPSIVAKYRKIITQLTSHDILNPATNQSVHCFPGAVVGLKFHGFLTVNSSDVPRGLKMAMFRQFLRHSFNLKNSHVSQIKKPTVMLLARTTTRRIINEEEVTGMMEELGFRVIVMNKSKLMSNLTLFSSIMNTCSVLVGVHGAGLVNGIFLPDGAVMVQVDIVGLEWPAATYYGESTPRMRLHYLRYKVDPEESSLLKIFGSRSHKAFTDPKGAFPDLVGREVYLNGQNVKINVERFRETMVVAMSLVQDSPL